MESVKPEVDQFEESAAVGNLDEQKFLNIFKRAYAAGLLIIVIISLLKKTYFQKTKACTRLKSQKNSEEHHQVLINDNQSIIISIKNFF